MPMISFNNLSSIYYNNRHIQRIYVGQTKVWQAKRKINYPFFSDGIYDNGDGTSWVNITPSIFEKIGIKASDVTHYIGFSGTWYPVYFEHRSYIAKVDIPYVDMFETGDLHTLVLSS